MKIIFRFILIRVFIDLKDSYNDKYEYVIPNITLNKFFASENYGYGNLQSNFKIEIMIQINLRDF